MNKLTVIGNLTRDPEHRTTREGVGLCNFTVAVNRKIGENQTVDYFRVTAWRALGEICGKYLEKGKKVCVVGPVTVSTYEGQDGKTRAVMELTAEDVEFLTPRGDEKPEAENKPASRGGDLVTVELDDTDLPF